ncbi:phosphoglycerate mutase family protein [Zunongwangia pacifica]|uniref:Histidine phosphatase family protein n=1 Tax=Zunongwangia pacifica TaxID=2911062 RepID=A0A9X1ZMR0_9FLAO|nr:phosphoglycerate mutase family protein [Zunongwangia pacifica]MCL6217602.1 histidine phosphatase family protein [Zunongwangia pacifica]
MKKNILYLLLSLVFIATSCQQQPQKNQEKSEPKFDKISTYYFIRHAEKDTTDTENHNPALTAEGKQRAENWKNVFTDVDFDAIYSSDFIRTKETAQPTADSKNLAIEIYDHTQLNSEEFQKATKGKKVLVVGHTNTTPYFANAVLGEDYFKNDIDETQHGKLFIVQVHLKGENTIQNLTIN